MIAAIKGLALVGLFAAASLSAVTAPNKRQSAEPSKFKLYAYGGDSIGGYPVFYADGLAYAGDSSALTEATEITGVNLTASSDGTWTATPESNVTWSSKVFYISKTTGEVGFTDKGNSSSGIITSGFRFYGRFAMLRVGGKMQAPWNAKDTDVDKVWTLRWGTVDASSLTSVMLRNAAPVTAPSKGK